MKYILLIAGFLILMQSGHAQSGYAYKNNKLKRLCFSFTPGIGFPMQDFAKKSYIPPSDSSHAVGYANPGFHFEVGVSYLFTNYIGIALQLGGTVCSFNSTAYASAYNVPDTFSVSPDGSHYVAQYLIGPFVSIPVTNTFSCEIKLLGGLVSSIYPQITVAPTNPSPYYQTFQYAHAQNMGYSLSVGGKLKVQENASIVANISYTTSDIVYSGAIFQLETPAVIPGAIPGSYTGFSNFNRSMQLGILSISVGVALCF